MFYSAFIFSTSFNLFKDVFLKLICKFSSSMSALTPSSHLFKKTLISSSVISQKQSRISFILYLPKKSQTNEQLFSNNIVRDISSFFKSMSFISQKTLAYTPQCDNVN
ncbi:hypothetical protein CDIK_3601 [Cucumispora dikerogammari]|nr:hypothetical protein CDIK_3601 [Cucumispora dikerogammari]